MLPIRYRWPLLALIVMLAPLLASCAANDYYRATVKPQGSVVVTVEHVVDGVATVVDERMASRDATITAQTTKPYFTYDGPWADHAPSAAPGTVLVRPTASRGLPASNPCPSEPPITTAGRGPALSPSTCAVPQPAAPAVSAAPDCPPSYVGCDGVPGGRRPTPGGTYKPRPPCDPPSARAPGLGDLPPPPSAKQVGAAVVALPVHVVRCIVGFAQCLLGIP